MSDLALRWDLHAADLVLTGQDLLLEDGLESAVLLSLFTDRRADPTDVLPDGHTDRRGWWADAYPVADGDRIGSRLWLLGRETQRDIVRSRAEAYAKESLEWLITDRVAEDIGVEATFDRPGWLVLAITIVRPLLDPVTYRFNVSWDAQAARGGL